MKCERCENDAAYVRKYSGQGLCSGCFSDSILRKMAKTISKYEMMRRGERIGVAVSGGKDSLALLHALSRIAGDRDFEMVAVTIDEGIPGYRDEALEIASEYCRGLDVEHHVYSYGDLFGITLDEALQARGSEKTTSCSICGTLRRRAIDRAAADLDVDAMATAHNLDDVLQTFLINMISGDTKKIGWMDPSSVAGPSRRIKPFGEIYEAEIVFYAFTNGIPFQTEPCPHMNEGIRTELREFLNGLEEAHVGAKGSLYRSVLKVAASMRDSARVEKSQCVECGMECTGSTCAACTTAARMRGANRMQI